MPLKATGPPSRVSPGGLKDYRHLLTRGISLLARLADVDQVVLCGPLMDVLIKTNSFGVLLQRQVEAQELAHLPQLVYKDVRDFYWQGAALAAWDAHFKALTAAG